MKRTDWAGVGCVNGGFICFPDLDLPNDIEWHAGIYRFIDTCQTFYACEPGRTQKTDFLRDVHSGKYDEPGVPRRHLTSLALRMGQDHNPYRVEWDSDDDSDTIIDMGD